MLPRNVINKFGTLSWDGDQVPPRLEKMLKNGKILKFSKVSYFSFEINSNWYSHCFQHQKIMQIDVSDAFRHAKITIFRNIFSKVEILENSENSISCSETHSWSSFLCKNRFFRRSCALEINKWCEALSPDGQISKIWGLRIKGTISLKM